MSLQPDERRLEGGVLHEAEGQFRALYGSGVKN
jgi:hypothetical protein